MSRRLVGRLVLGLAMALPAAQASHAQNGYVSPAFAQMGGQMHGTPMHQASQIPAHMASPLAGGPAAAVGNQFVDVRGNPIVMPASYGQPMPGCPPTMGGCPPMGGCGDPMAIDFGGYSEDQIGPHYYDVSFGAVFINSDTILDGVPALASTNVGPAAPRVLTPSDGLEDEYDPGFQIALRYDLGPLSVLEATYLGAYDFSFTESVASDPPGTFNLNTIFSNFGVPIQIPGVDAGSLFVIDYESDLQSTEFSYRRYWVGNSSRVTGTYLLGFRYVRLTEEFNFNITADDGNAIGNVVNSNLLYDTQNDILGFQLGGDGWMGLRQGLRVGCEGKAGVYNNRFEFISVGDFAEVPLPAVGPDDFTVTAEGNQVAFIGEAGVSVVADILPSWSLKAGYHAWYLNNLLTVASNIDTANFVPTTINSQNDALYHGFSAGAEYVW